MDNSFPPQGITIGYYPFRGKAQQLRLLCQYLHLPYKDLLLGPDQWSRFRKQEGSRWIVKDMPFLKQGDFVVTGHRAMTTYLIQYANRSDLLGKTPEDKAKVDSFTNKGCLKDIILSFICSQRKKLSHLKNQNRQQLGRLFQKRIRKLVSYHEEESQEDFYLGYLTIIDFSIYEIINYLEVLYPLELKKLPKLVAIRDSVASLEEIEDYETSFRAVKEYCPIRYFRKFKEDKIRMANVEKQGGATSTSNDNNTRIRS